MADGRATSNRVPDACGDPECEALCEPSGDGYSRCAAHATSDRKAKVREFIEENREWLSDWRHGQFSPSYDRDGWPIEMHGLALALEQAMEWLDD